MSLVLRKNEDNWERAGSALGPLPPGLLKPCLLCPLLLHQASSLRGERPRLAKLIKGSCLLRCCRLFAPSMLPQTGSQFLWEHSSFCFPTDTQLPLPVTQSTLFACRNVSEFLHPSCRAAIMEPSRQARRNKVIHTRVART